MSQQGKNPKEYEAIARIFNKAVAEILLSKPYSLLFQKALIKDKFYVIISTFFFRCDLKNEKLYDKTKRCFAKT